MYDALFTLLNFGIVAAVLYYGWNQYAVPALHAMAQKESATLEGMHEEHRSLIKQSQALDEMIVAQEAECQALSAKVVQWRNAVEEMHVKKAEEHASKQRRYRQINEEKSEKYRSALLYQKVKPLVLAHVEDDLRVHFQDSHAMSLYMNRLLRELKK